MRLVIAFSKVVPCHSHFYWNRSLRSHQIIIERLPLLVLCQFWNFMSRLDFLRFETLFGFRSWKLLLKLKRFSLGAIVARMICKYTNVLSLFYFETHLASLVWLVFTIMEYYYILFTTGTTITTCNWEGLFVLLSLFSPGTCFDHLFFNTLKIQGGNL